MFGWPFVEHCWFSGLVLTSRPFVELATCSFHGNPLKVLVLLVEIKIVMYMDLPWNNHDHATILFGILDKMDRISQSFSRSCLQSQTYNFGFAPIRWNKFIPPRKSDHLIISHFQ